MSSTAASPKNFGLAEHLRSLRKARLVFIRQEDKWEKNNLAGAASTDSTVGDQGGEGGVKEWMFNRTTDKKQYMQFLKH